MIDHDSFNLDELIVYTTICVRYIPMILLVITDYLLTQHLEGIPDTISN